MNDLFRELFYSTKNKGLIGFQELYRQAKPLNSKVTLKLAKEFVDAQENTQIFKEPRRDLFNPIVAPDHSYQCDLLFIRGRQVKSGFRDDGDYHTNGLLACYERQDR